MDPQGQVWKCEVGVELFEVSSMVVQYTSPIEVCDEIVQLPLPSDGLLRNTSLLH